MGLPGYRLRDVRTSDQYWACGCSKQDPERIRSGALVLTVCRSCGGLVTHERRRREA